MRHYSFPGPAITPAKILSKGYERILINSIKDYKIAKDIIIVLCEDDLLSDEGLVKLKSFVRWCQHLGVEIVTIYVSVIGDDEVENIIYPRLTSQILEVLSNTDTNVFIYTKYGTNNIKKSAKLQINVSIGFGGREELTEAIKQIMKDVEQGKIEPEKIDSEMIESHLIFRSEPDLIIRSGGRLTDFLIWQSIYSELYFTEVNWRNFRKLDLLRAIRDYQNRQRRYGK